MNLRGRWKLFSILKGSFQKLDITFFRNHIIQLASNSENYIVRNAVMMPIAVGSIYQWSVIETSVI